MSLEFKLFGIPAIILVLLLFLGWPFLLDLPVPPGLAVLHWIVWPFLVLASVAVIAIPFMVVLRGLAALVLAMFCRH